MISFSEIVIYSVWITHVVADCISFATTFYCRWLFMLLLPGQAVLSGELLYAVWVQ